jgi:Bacterial regulatory proteins, gntR family
LVHDALIDLIVAGELPPRQYMVETELARQLGVSRQPIREALYRMEAEGWVDLRPSQGAFVHVPTGQEVDNVGNHDTLAVVLGQAGRLDEAEAAARPPVHSLGLGPANLRFVHGTLLLEITHSLCPSSTLLGRCEGGGEPVGCQRLGAQGAGAEDEGQDDLQFSQDLVEGHPGAGTLGRRGSW